ncbi:hypothetical protein SAMN05414137_1831, partial [Streptacidiphilus jiangxiensis]
MSRLPRPGSVVVVISEQAAEYQRADVQDPA